MNRQRIFLLCCKKGCAIFKADLRSTLFGQSNSVFSDMTVTSWYVVFAFQDSEFATLDPPAVWNSLNEVPKHLWLAKSQTQSDKDRLHSMGNIVIPQQACSAAACLAHLQLQAQQAQV